jgi:hypothetical protein
MAVIGFGKYARPEFDMGIEDEVMIPRSIEAIPAEFAPHGSHEVEATVPAPAKGVLRIMMQQSTPDGYIRRTWAGGPPKGENMGKIFRIEVSEDGRTVPVRINYDKVIWSGLSWGVGEVSGLVAGKPVVIRCMSGEKDPVKLEVKVFRVAYE